MFIYLVYFTYYLENSHIQLYLIVFTFSPILFERNLSYSGTARLGTLDFVIMYGLKADSLVV